MLRRRPLVSTAVGVLAVLLVGSALVGSSGSEELRSAGEPRASSTTTGVDGERAPVTTLEEGVAGTIAPRVGRRGMAKGRAITPSPAAPATRPSPAGSPLPGAPGGRIAFTIWDDEGRPFIHTVRPDGTDLRKLTTGHTPRWSPDGSRLAFVDDAPVPSLFVARADGSDRRRLTVDLAQDPEWSPGGDEIAFVAVRPGGAYVTYSPLMPVAPGFEGDIAVVGVDGGVVRPVTAGPDVDYAPSWSPDGARIAFQRVQVEQREEGGNHAVLYAAGADGSGQRRLWAPPASGYLTGTSWAPGPRIAVTAGANGRSDGLWLVAGDGSSAEAINLGPAERQDPQWSPGADALLVGSVSSGGGLAAVTPDGRVLFTRSGSLAAWSHDGTQVAFYDEGRLWRMNRDGSHVVLLAGRFFCDGVAWSVPTGA